MILNAYVSSDFSILWWRNRHVLVLTQKYKWGGDQEIHRYNVTKLDGVAPMIADPSQFNAAPPQGNINQFEILHFTPQ